MLGDVTVGKTSLVKLFVDNEFQQKCFCTYGIEYKIKSFKLNPHTSVNLKIWDTCGEEKYKTITRNYYRGSNIVALVYDLTNKNTFDKLYGWLSDIQEYGPKDTCIVLVGNKSDVKIKERMLFEKGEKFANDNEMPFFRTSAKTGSNVLAMFEKLTKRVMSVDKRKKEEERDEDEWSENIVLERNGKKGKEEKKNDSGCC